MFYSALYRLRCFDSFKWLLSGVCFGGCRYTSPIHPRQRKFSNGVLMKRQSYDNDKVDQLAEDIAQAIKLLSVSLIIGTLPLILFFWIVAYFGQ